MRGLIYGDVSGSIYEWKPVEEQKNIKEPLRFTDDTVLGAAVADALITCWEQAITDDAGILRMVTQKIQEYGRRHPDAGYSRSFRAWLESSDPKPYGSKTNGAIMRCTSAGWLARSPQEANRLGRLTAMPTHDHPEAMDAAALTAEIIYRLRMGEPVDRMYVLLDEHYRIPALKDIRPITEFDFTCKTTLPIAFAAFYEAVLDRDILNNKGYTVVTRAVENAISLGGDTDTNAAIAAAFAEAWNSFWGFSEVDMLYKGTPPWYENEFRWQFQWADTEKYLTPDIVSVVRRLDKAAPQLCPVRICGEYAYRTDDRGEAVIVKYPCSEEGWKSYEEEIQDVLQVPEELDGLPVTAIGHMAFQPRFSMREFKTCIRIPDGVRMIGDYAFSHIRKVILPASVEVIGCRAFARYNSVGDELPANLKVLGAYAFEEVKRFPKLPDGLEYIGKKAISAYRGWDGHWAEDKCIIPRSVKRIAPDALHPMSVVFWVFRDSCGEEFCQKNNFINIKYFYADPEEAESENMRLLNDRQQEAEAKQRAYERYERERIAEQEENEYVEVPVQRYAGWREHYPAPYYYIDRDERVYEVRKKK